MITRAVQDSNSHVNLKSKERGTPNMVLRDAGTGQPPPRRRSRDQPVHFAVRGDDFLLEATTAEEVARRWPNGRTGHWIPLSWEPETRLRSYDEMAAGDAGETLASRSATAPRPPTSASWPTATCSAGRSTRLASRGSATTWSPRASESRCLLPDLVDHEPERSLREKLDALIEAEKAGTLSRRNGPGASKRCRQPS